MGDTRAGHMIFHRAYALFTSVVSLLGVCDLSPPPASMMSAAPVLTKLNASPMACAPDAQAVDAQWDGPCSPNRIDTWPELRLGKIRGMK